MFPSCRKRIMQMKEFHFYKFDNAEIVHIKNSVISFDEHCHTDDFVFTAIINGTAYLDKSNDKRLLENGNIFTVPPYQAHSLTSKENVELVSVCINKKIIYGLAPERFSEFLSNLLNNVPEQIVFNKEFLEKKVRKVYREYHNSLNTIQNIFEVSRDEIINSPESGKSIEQYAKEIYVSKFYYIKKIKKVSGLTPHKLIIQSRIRKSQLLLQSGSNIVDTALLTGFYDQSHFNKYFNKIVGVPPLEYLHSLSNFLQE